jgi:hypothetical protein
MMVERRNFRWLGMRLFVRSDGRQVAELHRAKTDRTKFCFATSDGFVSPWTDLDTAKIGAMDRAADLINNRASPP